MALAAQLKQTLVKDFQRHVGDTGSPEGRVAILTNRMRELSEHLQAQKHDFASRRGLVLMVGQRNLLMKYLSRTDREAYLALIKRLGLRK